MTNVDIQTKKRLEVFQKIAKKIKLNYKKHLINKVSKVFENRVKNDNDKYFGRDEYQNSVIVKSKKILLVVKKVLIKKFFPTNNLW